MTSDQRALVVAEARSWLGTPYHSHGRIKGAGADCAYMPLDVYSMALFPLLGIVPPPPPQYVQQWHLHQGEELYLDYVRSLGAIETQQPAAGDFVLFRIGRVYSHGAVIVGGSQVVHAENPRGVILADWSLDPTLSRIGITKPLFFTF